MNVPETCFATRLLNGSISWWSVVSDSVTPWTVAHQSPLSIELSRQDYQSGVTLPTPGDLPDQGTEPVSLASPAFKKDSLSLVHLGSPTSFHEQPQIIKHVRPCLRRLDGVLHFLFCLPASYHPTKSHQQDVTQPGLYCSASHSNTS